MATHTNINGDMSVLKSLLDNSGYFDSVTYDDTSGEVITCYVGQLAMLTITKTTGSGTNRGYVWAVIGDTPSYTLTVSAGSNPSDEPREAYECSGGLLITATNNDKSNLYRFIVTKNNSDVTTIVFSDTISYKVVTKCGAIAANDTGAYVQNLANTADGNQTVLVPACSCSGFGSLSYTPTVKISSYKQAAAFGYISYGNKRYLYDGYFAVEDTPSNSGGGAS